MKKILRLAGIILLGLILLIIFAVIISDRMPISVECQNCSAENGIGSKDAIILEFSQVVDPIMVEAAWDIDPFVSGSWEWANNQHAKWSADTFLNPAEPYTLSIRSSIIGLDGKAKVNDISWYVTVRSPKILFLQTSQENQSGQPHGENTQEIFYIDPGMDSEITQLTFTGGDIYDYASSPNGNMIIFSLNNDENGRDLWVINRDGADMHKILDCGIDLCSSAVFSPDNQKIAFVREQTDPDSGLVTQAVIWLLNLESNQAAALLNDPPIPGISPTWSPNGEWLSFWNSKSESIYITNPQTGEILIIKSIPGESGCWSAAANYLYYLKMDFIGATFFNVIQRADIENSTLETIVDWDGSDSYTSYEKLTCHPFKDWIGLTIQRNAKIPGREIAVIDPVTEDIITVSDDMTKIPAYLTWSPTGSQLMYQLGTFSQDLENAVYVWDAESRSSTLILENVFAPSWLP